MVAFLQRHRSDRFQPWLLAVLLWAPSSLAQAPSPAPRASPAAQARFSDGVAAFDEGRYRDAVELFKEADRLAPSALLSFNIATVYERMGDNRSALAAYRDYLRRLPHAENRVAVSHRIAELEQGLAALGVQQLSVLSTPPGATVVIDGVSRGVTPWTGELTPGAHGLALRLEGYAESEAELELPAARAIDVEVALVAVTGGQPSASQPPLDSAAGDASASAAVSPPLAPFEIARVPRWWTWTLFGGSAAALLGSGVFELARRDREDEARQSQVQIAHQQAYESMERRQTAARVFLGVGAVAALAGGVSLYLDLREASTPGDVALGCDPAGCTLQAGGQF